MRMGQDLLPRSGCVSRWLLSIQLFDKLDTKAEKIGELCCCVDFCLPGVLALAEHSGSHELVAVFCADEVGNLEKDGSAVCPRGGFPSGLVGERRLDGLGEQGRRGFMVCAQVGSMVVGERLLGEDTGSHRLAIYEAGHLKRQLLLHRDYGGFQRSALRGAWSIVFLRKMRLDTI